ncbi:MAG: nitrite/sulfite reductase, partial [Deltaproteobacteria bacterium]|nr:nitrite/sulfite reductase [Deltaproteobacteria bacterium]
MLSSRGGGGNTVRNITASADSGINPQEPFDVTPYALALTDRMISESDSFNLPRKVKIGFSNTLEDTAFASIQDLGFVARVVDGEPGFRVFVAGGMGAKPLSGHILHDFIPAGQVYQVTKAFKNMFDLNGNRRNKHKARIRFLWEKLGPETFHSLYSQELERVIAAGHPPLELPSQDDQLLENTSRSLGDINPDVPGKPWFNLWLKRHVCSQKQPGLFSVTLPLALGDISNVDAAALADLLEPFGKNIMRFTKDQNILLRNIPAEYLGNIFNGINSLNTLSEKPSFIGGITCCTGAATCKLGICLPRGVATAIKERLEQGALNLEALEGFRLNISGCPNSCGQHHSADLGLFGKVSRVEGRMMPAYYVVGGAEISGKGSSLARKLDEVAARDVPEFVVDVLETWQSTGEAGKGFGEWLNLGGEKAVQALATKYRERLEDVRSKPEKFQAEYLRDWGASEEFTVAGRGMGECSAGLFDMIDLDLETARKQTGLLDSAPPEEKAQVAREGIRAATRMLLITRGLEPGDDEAAFRAFQRHFIDTGLVGSHYAILINMALQENYLELANLGYMLEELVRDLENLYRGMDDSLRFTRGHGQEPAVPASGAASSGEERVGGD